MKACPPPQQFAGASRLKIGDVRIDMHYRRIVRPDQHIELPQRMFDLLLLLLSEPGVLHTRKALFDRLWPDVVVEDSNLSQSVWMLRKALGEERKHWIRTVSKSGYIFDPPGPVEIVVDVASALQQSTEDDTGSADGTASDIVSEPPATVTRTSANADTQPVHRHRPGLRLPALFMLLLTMTIALTSSTGSERRPAGPVDKAPEQVVVVVLQAKPTSGGDGHGPPQWPVDLLDEWLSWKLDLLPEAIRLQEADISASATHAETRMVVLSSESVPGNSSEVVLRARLGKAGDRNGAETIISRGGIDEMPIMVDALSRRILARLLPPRADSEWPALMLDASAAERYGRTAAAIRRRDWDSAIEGAQAVIRVAPGFGMAQLRLAEVERRRGRIRESLDHMAKARRDIAPIPQDAARILDAYDASFDPRRQRQAMEAYGSLVHDYPGRSDFAFMHARLLTRAGRPREAYDILSGRDGQGDLNAPGIRIRHRIALSETELAMGYPARARNHAQQALNLTALAGDGWDQERGSIRMLLAMAHHNEPGRERSPQLFELAARSFDSAGDRLNALYARFLAEYVRAPTGDIMSARMRALLAETRLHGYSSLEVELLRRAAYSRYNAGQHIEFRELLQQALQAANASGDIVQQRLLDLDLLNQDMLIGNHTSAEVRIDRLLRNGIPGENAFWVIHFDAAILSQRGRYREALERIQRNELAATEDGRMPTPELSAARLACLRVDILLAKGDVGAARALLDRCRNPEEPFIRLNAQLSEAAADVLEDDLAHARVTLNDVEQAISAMPNSADRWILSTTAAALLVRAGEYERAERLCRAALPTAESAGYSLVAAHLETSLAEIAAARKDWPRSRQLADAARRRVSPDNWALTSRLDMLSIVDALLAADAKTAAGRISTLRRQAAQLHDAVALAQLDSVTDMLPARTLDIPNTRRTARQSLRGATMDWLIAPQHPIANAGTTADTRTD